MATVKALNAVLDAGRTRSRPRRRSERSPPKTSQRGHLAGMLSVDRGQFANPNLPSAPEKQGVFLDLRALAAAGTPETDDDPRLKLVPGEAKALH